MSDSLLLWSLFSGSFLSATLLPGNSEIVFVALLAKTSLAPWVLLVVATVGNTLGGMTNVAIGRFSRRFKRDKRVRRVLPWLRRYGVWTLLLSWLPLVGDLLCILAGWLKFPIGKVTLMIFIGKLLRYVVLLIATYVSGLA